MAKFKVSPWHGESRTVFYVVNTENGEIVNSYYRRAVADNACDRLNASHSVIEKASNAGLYAETAKDAMLQEMYADDISDPWIVDEVNFLFATLEKK